MTENLTDSEFMNEQPADGIEIVSLNGDLIQKLVPIHIEAFYDRMSGKLGPGYARAFLTWFSRRKDGIALAAIIEGKPVGYTCGAIMGYQREINRDLLWTVFLAALIRPWIWFRLSFLQIVKNRFQVLIGRKKQATLDFLPAPTICQVGTGVARSARNKGVGIALRSGLEAEARRRGIKSILGSVYRDNIPARGLDEKCGWRAFDSDKKKATVYYYKIFD